jgi:hypothetical protein
MSHTLLTTDVLAKLLVKGPASGSPVRGACATDYGVAPENSLPFECKGVAPDCVRVVALKCLDTGNVSFSTTAAKQ